MKIPCDDALIAKRKEGSNERMNVRIENTRIKVTILFKGTRMNKRRSILFKRGEGRRLVQCLASIFSLVGHSIFSKHSKRVKERNLCKIFLYLILGIYHLLDLLDLLSIFHPTFY